MYCMKCGNQLPDSAQFCSVCGAAQSSDATKSTGNVSKTPETVYEYCEIVYESKIGIIFMKGRLWAKATGPKGVYTAACEEKWRNGLPNDLGARKGYQSACDQMIIQLQNDGWEILPYSGANYWSYKFRRPVR